MSSGARPFASRAFAIELSHQHRAATAKLQGELDIAAAEDALAVLLDVVRGEPEELLVDLRELRFLDASGLRALVRLEATCRETGIPLRLVPGSPPVQRLFELTDYERILPFEATKEEDDGQTRW